MVPGTVPGTYAGRSTAGNLGFDAGCSTRSFRCDTEHVLLESPNWRTGEVALVALGELRQREVAESEVRRMEVGLLPFLRLSLATVSHADWPGPTAVSRDMARAWMVVVSIR